MLPHTCRVSSGPISIISEFHTQNKPLNAALEQHALQRTPFLTSSTLHSMDSCISTVIVCGPSRPSPRAGG
jgi:hypothetical protein